MSGIRQQPQRIIPETRCKLGYNKCQVQGNTDDKGFIQRGYFVMMMVVMMLFHIRSYFYLSNNMGQNYVLPIGKNSQGTD
jgi:hypothetical protein